MISTMTDSGAIYHHNGDFGGSVLVDVTVVSDADESRRLEDVMPVTYGITQRHPGSENSHITVRIPAAHILQLALNHLRSLEISALEQMNVAELTRYYTTGVGSSDV